MAKVIGDWNREEELKATEKGVWQPDVINDNLRGTHTHKVIAFAANFVAQTTKSFPHFHTKHMRQRELLKSGPAFHYDSQLIFRIVMSFPMCIT